LELFRIFCSKVWKKWQQSCPQAAVKFLTWLDNKDIRLGGSCSKDTKAKVFFFHPAGHLHLPKLFFSDIQGNQKLAR